MCVKLIYETYKTKYIMYLIFIDLNKKRKNVYKNFFNYFKFF